MRAHFKLSRNTEQVPFTYQENLVRSFHKWLGYNKEHDAMSLYSMSWLSMGKVGKNGLEFKNGAHWFISSAKIEILQKAIQGAQSNPDIGFGMRVQEIQLEPVPNFCNQNTFMAETPVLVRERREDGKHKFLFYNDTKAGEILTETLRRKLELIGESNVDFEISFDQKYHSPKTKMSTYKGVHNKGSICPVIIKGDEKAKIAAWCMGVGHSTGIGFGALK